jgi:hypothetical protein
MTKVLGISSEIEKVRSHLEVNKIKFKHHYENPDTFIFMTGVLKVVLVNKKPTFQFNGVKIKFSEIRDAVTLVTPTQEDIDETLASSSTPVMMKSDNVADFGKYRLFTGKEC